MNVQIDHVHLVVRLPPSLSISGYMGFVKGRTAIRLFNKFPYLRKKKLWGNHFWQRGYFVDSVGMRKLFEDMSGTKIVWERKKKSGKCF